MKQFAFPHSTNFKLLRQIEENSVNNCNFLKFIFFFLTGCHCNHLPWAPKKPSFATDYDEDDESVVTVKIKPRAKLF
jgi:hypothetical protein